MSEATETESWHCTDVSSIDRMQLNNSRRQQSLFSIIPTWGPSIQIQPSPFLIISSVMHVKGFCSAISRRLCIYYQNQQLLPVSGGSESVVTVSCMSEANVSLSLSSNPGKGCAVDLKSWMTCVTTATSSFSTCTLDSHLLRVLYQMLY